MKVEFEIKENLSIHSFLIRQGDSAFVKYYDSDVPAFNSFLSDTIKRQLDFQMSIYPFNSFLSDTHETVTEIGGKQLFQFIPFWYG